MKSHYRMKLKVKPIEMETGTYVVVMNKEDAKELGVMPLERIEIHNDDTQESIGVVVNVSKNFVKKGELGVYKDVFEAIKPSKELYVGISKHLDSVTYIKKKLQNQKLTYDEIKCIVDDINNNYLSQIEMASFMTAVYINGFDLDESYSMADSILKSGNIIDFNKPNIVDKHCIGGINGRATMLVVPIIAAAGLTMPKTSSRAITSAAGTADSMEVLANVNLSFEDMKRILDKTNGFIAWGGALDIAPVDDKIIKIEYPLSLDPHGQVIASVLAKKASVGAKKVIIDLPVGPELKVKTIDEARKLAEGFVIVGRKLGMEVKSLITNGSVPSGPAFGCALEAKQVLEILEGKVHDNLAEKACELAGILLEMGGKAKEGEGLKKAKQILNSGQALKKMKEIIAAQGEICSSSEKVPISDKFIDVYAETSGYVSDMSIKGLNQIARFAGAPSDKLAGVLLHVRPHSDINRGDKLYTIYGTNLDKLQFAYAYAKKIKPIHFENIILSRVE
ncbi:MAG: AMP phosphorylase [Candidatus ainarchaeum sp.]|nr:AMP phosphorylase [Candidatus ainarchaeum sp.]